MPYVPRPVPLCACGTCAECQIRASFDRQHPVSPSPTPASPSPAPETSTATEGAWGAFSPIVPAVPSGLLDRVIEADIAAHGTAARVGVVE